ncbi:MAG: DinB family protein [Chloroflexi bacterium]|nr:DinB family protein [Chloroflexota bacterium]
MAGRGCAAKARRMEVIKMFRYSTAAEMSSDFEQMWSTWDELIAAVPPKRWSSKYGPDWTFQDVPYHVAYFDRVMVADVIEAGTALPADQRFECRTMRQVNDWNRAEFAKRRVGQTPQESIEEMRRQRARIRRLLDGMTDADLERPAFSHFFGIGFSTVGAALAGARQHAFSEGWELAHRLKRRDIRFPEPAVRRGVDTYVNLMALMLNHEAAATVGSFTVLMDMPGYGGGTWTIRLVNGVATVSEGRAGTADVIMTLSTNTYMAMFKKLRNPLVLMLTGKIRVKGFSKMGTFGKIFSEPELDTPMKVVPNAAAAAGVVS